MSSRRAIASSLLTIATLSFKPLVVTNPHQYGLITTTKLSPSARRGLILVAKLMTAMGTNSSFNSKEQYLSPLDPFLVEWKWKVREFVHWTAVVSPVCFGDEWFGWWSSKMT